MALVFVAPKIIFLKGYINGLSSASTRFVDVMIDTLICKKEKKDTISPSCKHSVDWEL